MTLRELVWMAEGRCRQEWNHTAYLAAMIANANRDTKRKPTPFRPSDFHPYAGTGGAARRESQSIPAKIDILKAVFVDRKGKGKT